MRGMTRMTNDDDGDGDLTDENEAFFLFLSEEFGEF